MTCTTRAYRAAIAADKRLSDLLRVEYGDDAGTARYLPDRDHPEHIQRAIHVKTVADQAYLDATRQ